LQKTACSKKVPQEKCHMEVHEAPLFGPLLGLKTVKWENSNCTRAVSSIKEGQNHPLEEYLVSNGVRNPKLK
jgi:hypothetical protein